MEYIRVYMNKDDLKNILLERLKHWTGGENWNYPKYVAEITLAVDEDYLTDKEIDIKSVVDNLFVNETHIVPEHILRRRGIINEEEELDKP